LADIIVRPLTADDSQADHFDLSVRAFAPHDKAVLRVMVAPVIADGRVLAAFDGDRMVGVAFFSMTCVSGGSASRSRWPACPGSRSRPSTAAGEWAGAW
jgi:hypothetical protein